jgi:hypothetical protein
MLVVVLNCPAGADIAEQALQAGALQGSARESAVVVAGGQRRPTLVALAADVGVAGLALRMEGVELLLEPLLRGLSDVDRAVKGSALKSWASGPLLHLV